MLDEVEPRNLGRILVAIFLVLSIIQSNLVLGVQKWVLIRVQ